jgi:hypothetical protein
MARAGLAARKPKSDPSPAYSPILPGNTATTYNPDGTMVTNVAGPTGGGEFDMGNWDPYALVPRGPMISATSQAQALRGPRAPSRAPSGFGFAGLTPLPPALPTYDPVEAMREGERNDAIRAQDYQRLGIQPGGGRRG